MAAAELQKDLDEVKYLLSLSKRPNIRLLLEGEVSKISSAISAAPPQQQKPIKTVKKSCPTKKIVNYAWDETNKLVKVYVTGIKDASVSIEKENIETCFEKRSVSVLLRDVNGTNYTLTISNLNANIVADDSTLKTTKSGFTLLLKKEVEGKWNNIKLVKEDKKDDMPKLDKDADPSAGLMNLMKHMYESGDDEMKRTIAKSMYEAQQKQKSGDSSLPDIGDKSLPDLGDL